MFGVPCTQAVAGIDGPQVWRQAANVLNKQRTRAVHQLWGWAKDNRTKKVKRVTNVAQGFKYGSEIWIICKQLIFYSKMRVS